MLKVKSVECPSCHRSFLDNEQLIKNEPTIALHGRIPTEDGGEDVIIRLSSLYGEYEIIVSGAIENGAIVEFSCPFCQYILSGDRTCRVCEAPMSALQMGKGGMLQFCSRRGCKKHLLEFDDPEADLKAFYEEHLPYME